MAEYKETNVSGKAWQRTYQILILSPLGQSSTVRYDEEAVINLEDHQIRQHVGSIGHDIKSTEKIALRDPETLELTGETVLFGLVQQALISDYINRALERDVSVNLTPKAE